MKIKFNKTKRVSDPETVVSEPRQVRPERLDRLYDDPRMFLKKKLDVIEVSVQEQLETVFNDYAAWRKGKAKQPKYVFNMLQDISFVSILPRILKNNYDYLMEHGEEFSEMISSAVTNLMRHRLSKSRDMIAIYANIYEDINEKRINKIFNLDIPGIEWEDALKLCIVSHGSPSHTMISTLKILYGILKTKDQKTIYKLLAKLYGKDDMDKVSVYILLEKGYEKVRNNWIDSELYSVFTNIALQKINSYSRADIIELLKIYCEERRKSEYEILIRRRVNFSSISKEDYSKICSAVKKVSKKNDMYKSFLDQTRIR